MADIKTRIVDKGSIKTIDRASIMTQHIKDSTVKIKDTSPTEKQDAQNAENYAQNKISDYSKSATDKVTLLSTEATKQSIKLASKTKEAVEIKRRKNALLRSRNKGSDNSITHSPKIKTPKDVQKAKAARKAAMLKNARQQVAIRNALRAQHAARTTRIVAIKTAHAASHTVKAIIASTKALIAAISAAGAVALIIVIICVLFGAAFYFFGDESSDSYIPVSPEVEAYTPEITKYCKLYGIPEYVELVKAVMMQESGGRGTDPMQSSECGFNTKYPNKPGSIKEPEYSIKCGVRYLAQNLKAANVSSPVDMDKIKLALQGYNFGSGYISWALKTYGGYSKANAEEFSKKQGGSYGDVNYVEHVLRYYPYGNYSYDIIYNGPGKLGLPIKGMTRGNITSHFGPRSSPGGIGSTNHKGVDIGFPTGTKVLACESGTVTTASWYGGYGKCIIIDHGKGIQTLYAHLSDIGVAKGQKVVRGQVIGKVGNTGNSTGPHLHLSVLVNGSYVNPEKGWLSLK